MKALWLAYGCLGKPEEVDCAKPAFTLASCPGVNSLRAPNSQGSMGERPAQRPPGVVQMLPTSSLEFRLELLPRQANPISLHCTVGVMEILMAENNHLCFNSFYCGLAKIYQRTLYG